jgi:hypothetical protein
LELEAWILKQPFPPITCKEELFVQEYILSSWAEIVTIFLYKFFCSGDMVQLKKSYRFSGQLENTLKAYHTIKSSYLGLVSDAFFRTKFQTNNETAAAYDTEFAKIVAQITLKENQQNSSLFF